MGVPEAKRFQQKWGFLRRFAPMLGALLAACGGGASGEVAASAGATGAAAPALAHAGAVAAPGLARAAAGASAVSPPGASPAVGGSGSIAAGGRDGPLVAGAGPLASVPPGRAGAPTPGAGSNDGEAGGTGAAGTQLPSGGASAGAAGPGDSVSSGAEPGSAAGAAGAGGVSATPLPASCPALPTPPSSGRCAVEAGTDGTLLLVADLATPDEVIERGQLRIDADGRIACVGCDCALTAAAATHVTCPDAVALPGLINAHDHGAWMNGEPVGELDYVDRSGTPLAADPATRFEHRNDWRESGNASLPKLAAPGGSAALAAKTHGEVRFALGGATTTFASTRLTGLLRDVDDSSLADARTRNVVGHAFATYETFPLGSSAQAASGCGAYSLRGPSGPYPWVAHVAEGIDATARNEFLCLTGLVPGGFDALDARTALVHAVGLLPRDLAHLASLGGKVVWSPRSNLVLYGDTARVVTMDHLGITLALGTDWLPTGSMHLLRELRCADAFNRDYLGGHFTDLALVRMVTTGAASALGYADALGRLEVGLFGDLTVIARGGRSPHRAVLEAEEADVVLTLRGGVPTVGDAEVVEALAPGCDAIGAICGVEKRACVERDTGQSWATILAAVGPASYPLAGCGAPPGEPACLPRRTLPEDAIDGLSSLYTGTSERDDADGDGRLDLDDDCPAVFDPIRPLDDGAPADADGDGLGDACDPCPLASFAVECGGDADGDGAPDATDLCPYDPDSASEDADGDGWGDACDACPEAANPGVAICPGPARRIGELWALGDGVDATLDGVCVTAVKPPYRMWVQDPVMGDGATSDGLFIYAREATLTSVAPGDRIRVSGRTDTYAGAFELTLPVLTLLERGAAECSTPALVRVVTPAEVAPGAASELARRYLLVRLQGATVTKSATADAPLEIELGLRVSSYLAGAAAVNLPAGTRLASLTAVVDAYQGTQLLPRSGEDLVLE